MSIACMGIGAKQTEADDAGCNSCSHATTAASLSRRRRCRHNGAEGEHHCQKRAHDLLEHCRSPVSIRWINQRVVVSSNGRNWSAHGQA